MQCIPDTSEINMYQQKLAQCLPLSHQGIATSASKWFCSATSDFHGIRILDKAAAAVAAAMLAAKPLAQRNQTKKRLDSCGPKQPVTNGLNRLEHDHAFGFISPGSPVRPGLTQLAAVVTGHTVKSHLPSQNWYQY